MALLGVARHRTQKHAHDVYFSTTVYRGAFASELWRCVRAARYCRPNKRLAYLLLTMGGSQDAVVTGGGRRQRNGIFPEQSRLTIRSTRSLKLQ